MAKDVEPQTAFDARRGQTGGGERRWTRRFAGHTGICIAILIATICGVLIFRESPLAFLTAMTDGVVAAGIVAAAALAGLWLVWGTGNGDLPVRWQLALGAGFGLGGLSLGMLWAGLRGHLGQVTWIVVMGVLAAAGLAALYRLSQRGRDQEHIAAGKKATLPGLNKTVTVTCFEGQTHPGHWRWMWLLIVPVVTLAVLAATVPPGILWEEEANGYDVLEYHLGVPRDWFFAGRIIYLDNNMYSNFPMNAEMLYLLSMILFASPWKAAIVAQFISLAQGAMAGYAAWLIGRDYSRRAGMIAGMAGVAMPWVTYFGALAYVENGMLFYGLLAAGLCNRAIRDWRERNWSRALALGAMAGLACGYKYTAIPLVAAPLLCLWVVLSLVGPRRSLYNAVIPLIVAATAFAPWAAKNQRMTGDPVFPLGYCVFGSRIWTPAQHQKFVDAHSPLPAERPVAQRFAKLWQRVIAQPRFGYVPWVAAAVAAGLLLWRRMAYRRPIAIWLAVLVVDILLWMFATHLYARFAGVLWIPLLILIATLAAWLTGPLDASDRVLGAVPEPGPSVTSQAPSERNQSRGDGHARRQDPKASAPGVAPANLGMAVCIIALAVYITAGQSWLWPEYNRHLRPRGRLLPVQGAPELFYFGRVPGFEHLQYINGNGKHQKGLPYDVKLLMVGDARVFYVGRPCDYWVTFSTSPFADAVHSAGGKPGPIMDWLRRQGYTHVWVDFAEIRRLSRTYGFALSIDEDLFRRLAGAGLRPLHVAQLDPSSMYGILFEVPRS
jgi:hypothetical protein